MPLQTGHSEKTISENIAELIAAGKSKEQAVAIAYKLAGKTKDEKRYFTTVQISERLSTTPEGFLVCESVPIARAGDLLYHPSETPITPADGKMTVVSRTVNDIHDSLTIKSFEGKPITIGHPDEFVGPENWKELAVGVTQNVRPGEAGTDDEDKLLADLLITDFEAIEAIKSKRMREVSCGYEAEFIEDAPGKGRQIDIRGNHIALVDKGRCGPECAVMDSFNKGGLMSVKEKILNVFGKALDEAMPEEKIKDEGDVASMLASIMERLAAIEAAMKPAESMDKKEEVAPEVATVDAVPSELDARLAKIEAALAKLVGEEESEVESEMMDKTTDSAIDSDTIARAEILAPGISKTADVKVKALDSAYQTTDGKQVIDTLLCGKPYAEADKDLLFVGASELLKSARRTTLQGAKVVDSQKPSVPQSASELNAFYADFHKKGV